MKPDQLTKLNWVDGMEAPECHSVHLVLEYARPRFQNVPWMELER
jgi:hypothetical protein